MFSIEEAIATFRVAEWTAMLVDRQGEITGLVARQGSPEPAFIADLNDRFPRTGFHLFPRGESSREDVQRTIRSILEAFEFFEAQRQAEVDV